MGWGGVGANGLGVGVWGVGGGGQTIRKATGVGVGGPKNGPEIKRPVSPQNWPRISYHVFVF